MSAQSSSIRERLAWPVSTQLYERIRSLWVAHSKAEDGRHLEGLIATLTPDCIYEIVPTGERWEGHAGATDFYTGFLGAYPDVDFDLKDIVIGPQGVIEVTTLSASRRVKTWGGLEPSSEPISGEVIIHFPWDPERELFLGERIYFDSAALTGRSS